MLHRFGVRATALALFFVLFLGSTLAVRAQASTYIAGTVSDGGSPVADHEVTLAGNNLTLRTKTDTHGHFTFNALTVGTYTISTPGRSGATSTQVDLTSAGATVTLDMAGVKEIGRVSVSSSPVVRASGSDTVVTGTQLSRSPGGSSLPDILTQIPTAARGSNGQIHVNGDHNGLNYIVDGVQIPEGLNRVLGNEIDPANIGFAEIIEGAYPAQYGDRFAAVVNISTRSKTGPPGANVDLTGGSYGLFDTVVGAHTPLGNGALYVGSRLARNDRVLDPPVPGFVHDQGSTTSQFLRYSTLVNGADTLTFDLTHSLQTFQIPPDTSSGTPAVTDDDESQ
ncbi:MAG: TonB-dependent receptor, partial [Candidatus Eremiobacteraeota bacterium]|nr:TonB-dependent receptor [Candidatus Eremiobacteraeota bacterium]MBV9409017.1 TonB-dependent receptor [Candidatus Eremiobacteraeota bacterium]